MSDIMSFFGSAHLLNSRRREATLDLLVAVQTVALQIAMQIKHFCWSARPQDLSPSVLPIIQTPDHSSFPSGHAIEAFAIATVLHGLATGVYVGTAQQGFEKWSLPFRIAHRIMVNRVIAGVHFPVDGTAGALIGCTLGEAVLAAASGTPALGINRVFKVEDHLDGDSTRDAIQATLANGAAAAPPELKLLTTHWREVIAESWPAPANGGN